MAKKPAHRQAQKRSFPILWVAAGVVVLIGVIAVIASRGSDSDSDSAAGVKETRPVAVSGTPLPEYQSGQSPDAAVGTVAPELRGASFDGTPVNVTNDGKGKVVIFVAHWCPHCQKEVPLISEYLASNQPPAGVDLYAVSTSANADAPNYPPSTWLAREKWPIRTLADNANGDAASAYGLTSFPYFVVTDASGKVVTRATGEISMDEFAALMQQAAGGAPASS
jgi:thiol-disulfide isomerase/thioredoxin